MKPQDDYRNGDGGGTASSASRSDESSGGEESVGGEEEWSLVDGGGPARVLAALNALRKARQHYDVVLTCGGAELPAHRAVLAAASPRLLTALATLPAGDTLLLPDLEPDALSHLVEFVYTGRLRARSSAGARRLYRAAARLRIEAARAPLAERLLRAPAPADCLELRALPDLSPTQRHTLDAYITEHFEAVCAGGALAALPQLRLELLRDVGRDGGEEPAAAVAGAALAWLRDRARDRRPTDADMEELCSRTHLLFTGVGGTLRDCGERPAAAGDAPELQEYRRQREQERERIARKKEREPRTTDEDESVSAVVGAGGGGGEWGVVAARGGPGGGVVAVLALGGRLVAARVGGRAAGGGTPGVGAAGERAHMATARCAAAAAVLDGRLVVCGGYDRARVLRAVEAYDPETDAWSALPEMRSARARFPAARLGSALYVVGGSDGHAELAAVDVLENGVWRAAAPLPLARAHAAAAADEAGTRLYVAGGWAGGRPLRAVHQYCPRVDAWVEAAPLGTARSQCAGAVWDNAVWVLGGCDAWNCLATTEYLPLDNPVAWLPGPPLPTARRSVGAAAWGGRLVAAGGWAGGAPLAATAFLEPGGEWAPGPPLRRARAAPALAELGGALYAAGGFSAGSFLACVECLLAPDQHWTTLAAPRTPPVPPSNGDVTDEDTNHQRIPDKLTELKREEVTQQ